MNNKNVLIDHATKKIMNDNEVERIRQDLEIRLYKYYGYPIEYMDIDAKVNGNNIKADLVVYNNSEKTDISLACYVIDRNGSIEDCLKKIKNISNDRKEIKYFIIYNGEEMKVISNNKDNFEVPDLPSYNQNSDLLLKSELKIADKQLKLVFKEIHNYLYANSNIKIANKLGQEVIKLILCKIHDEKSQSEKCEFRANQFNSDNYINETLKRVEIIWNKVKHKIAEYEDEKLELDSNSIYYVVSKLQHFNFIDTNSDIIGESFQIFIDQTRLQNLGAFFTEIQAVKLGIEMLDIEPSNNERFIDPFQGTGGFVQEFANKVLEKNKINNCNIDKLDNKNFAIEYCNNNLFGIDIESELVKLAKAKMLIVGDIDNKMFNENSLDNPENWGFETKKNIVLGTFDKVGSNPPFGTKIKINSIDILKQYDLSRKWIRRKIGDKYSWEIGSRESKPNPRVPDILGLERIVQLLTKPEYDKDGRVIRKAGMGAVVLPRQILSGPKELYVREWLMRNTIIQAVIDLPSETFQPHTGTKTSIVLFTKRENENKEWFKDNHKIFMAIPKKIGHDRRGIAEYKRDEDGFLIEDAVNNEYILDTDIPTVLEAWKLYKNNKDIANNFENCFEIQLRDINLEYIRLDASHYDRDSYEIMNKIDRINEKSNGKWKVKKLGELTEKVFCPGRCKRMYVDDKEKGLPFLSGTNISQYIPINPKYISKKMKGIENYILEPNWILITRSGTTGVVSLVPDDWAGMTASDHIIRIVPNKNKITAEYLYLFLKSEFGQNLLRKGIYGSVVDEITPEFISNLEIPYSDNDDEIKEVCNIMKESIELKNKAMKCLSECESKIADILSEIDSEE